MSLEAGRNYVLVNRYIKEGNQNGTAMDLSGGTGIVLLPFPNLNVTDEPIAILRRPQIHHWIWETWRR